MSMLSNRKIEIDTQHNVSKPIIYEQNEWVREKLSQIWGENKADYFVNPERVPRKSSLDTRDDEMHKNLADPRNRGSRTGLYAYMIWDNIREDAGNKFKVYSLDKDLHSLNYYEKVKEKLAEDLAESRLIGTSSKKKLANKEDQTTKLNNSYSDTSRMKKNKVYRSEIELMYRSSKMNEEKVNVMRNNVPLPDMNDQDGKDSIIRYLPPIINLNNDLSRPRNMHSSLEFITSPTMRKKYKKKMEYNLAHKNDVQNYTLLNDKNNKIKADIQNVKLHFLTERPAREYMSASQKGAECGETNRSSDITQSDEMSQLRIEDSKSESKQECYQEKTTQALVPYDSKSLSYPPLSMNALMEYKPMIKAPGTGDFDNGKPKLFRLTQP